MLKTTAVTKRTSNQRASSSRSLVNKSLHKHMLAVNSLHEKSLTSATSSAKSATSIESVKIVKSIKRVKSAANQRALNKGSLYTKALLQSSPFQESLHDKTFTTVSPAAMPLHK